jgi:hypothetical protein
MKRGFILILLFSLLIISKTATAQGTSTEIFGGVKEIIRNIAIALAVLMIVIGGFKWMTSAGDPSKISDAKDQIFAAILGLLIIALAEIIAALVGG